jgi:hypothetical protein
MQIIVLLDVSFYKKVGLHGLHFLFHDKNSYFAD